MVILFSIVSLYIAFGALVGAIGCWMHLYQHLDDKEPVLKIIKESLVIFLFNMLTWPKIVRQIFGS